jgi:hypothetical protein
MTGRRLIVRCADRMCFPIDAQTLDPLACSSYDAYCFIDPHPNTIDYADWVTRRSKQRSSADTSAIQEGGQR